LPFLSIVGCSLASGSGVLTKEDELEGICWEIREAVTKYQSRLHDKIIDGQTNENLSLEDFDIGPPIAKGCNAVVYAAAFKNYHAKDLAKVADQPSTSYEEFLTPAMDIKLPKYAPNIHASVDNLNEILASPRDSFVALRNFENSPMNLDLMKSVKFSERVDVRTRSRFSSMSEDSDNSHENSSDDANIYHYPWALKMMFNYDIQSNAMAILRAMYKETVPAQSRLDSVEVENWEKVIMEQTATLPAHPNIVLMPGYFCDQIPNLMNARTLFPSALPSRLNPNGYGRNMSLFLLMKRYDNNLRDFLKSDVDMRTRIILFAQLLEAVAHLNRFGVAHRDLKSDNILIDTSSDSLPLLVLSDFGCCLADKVNGLKLPYSTHEMEKGGNQALMAPEIINKEPSMFAVLNYSKSDLWACGAIAYEIFGYQNPFYNPVNGHSSNVIPALTNQNYHESMLPEMGDDVPLVVRKLVENILQKSPSRRLSCDVAANVLELYLWAPSSWIRFGRNPTNSEVNF
jgi:PTEN induced putative kinase 1